MTRPNFAVAADETSPRRLGAVIREEIYRIVQASYTFGVQSESGLVRLDQAQSALNAQRDRIYSKIEALLMLIDVMSEMKDVNVNSKGEVLKPVRRDRTKGASSIPDMLATETTGVPSRPATEDVGTVKNGPTPDAPRPARLYDPVEDSAAQDLVDRVLAGLEANR